MPINSARFRFEADNTSAMKGLGDLQRKVKDLGNDVQKELGSKLSSAISITLIEEAVRRTGEWATQLSRTSKELGISTEELQTLQVAAERAGIAQDKILIYYDKIEVAAAEALSGNQKLIKSFRDLGITTDKLKTGKASDLMTSMFANASKPGGAQGLINVFGGRELNNISALRGELGGKSMAEYQAAHASQIVPEGEVDSMAKAWTNIVEDIKAIGNKLKPLVAIILSIVDGVLKMANGVFGTITSFINPSKWKSGENTIRAKSLGRGLVNFIPQTGAGIVNAITRVGGGKSKDMVDWHWMKSGKDAYGDKISDEAYRESEGAAEGLATVATFGVGPIAKGIGLGAKGVSTAAELVNADRIAGAAGGIGSKLSGMGGNGLLGKLLDTRITANAQGGVDIAFKEISKELGGVKAADVKSAVDLLAERVGAAKGASTAETFNNIKELAKKAANRDFAGGTGTIGSLLAAGGIGQGDVGDISKLIGSPNRLAGGAGFSGLGSLFTGGSSNLGIGGVFGVDLQAKIMRLNEKQTDLLQQIVDNTNIMAEATNNMINTSTMETGTGN